MKRQLYLLKLSEKESKEVKAGFAAVKRDNYSDGNSGLTCGDGKYPKLGYINQN